MDRTHKEIGLWRGLLLNFHLPAGEKRSYSYRPVNREQFLGKYKSWRESRDFTKTSKFLGKRRFLWAQKTLWTKLHLVLTVDLWVYPLSPEVRHLF